MKRKVRRNLHWDIEAWRDFLNWQQAGGPTFERLLLLLEECLGDEPFKGTGKPEPLKHDLAGLWSRRITQEHRLVYDVSDECIYVYQCKTHYKKS